MADLIAMAQRRLEEIEKRALAHENSAEYHRRRDARLSTTAKVFSAVIGTSVFVGLLSKLGIDGSKEFSVPPGWRWFYWTVLGVSLIGPALTAGQIALHDVDDVSRHTVSFSDYRRLADDMQVFLSRPPSDPSAVESAFKKFSQEFDRIYKASIQLTDRAKRQVGLGATG